MRNIVILAALSVSLSLLTPRDASADTIAEAFRDAVVASPELALQRARLKAQRQAVPLALAEALPQIEFSATAQRIFADDPTFRQRGPEKREDWGGNASGSQLIFGSGRVWSRYRQARAQVLAAESLYEEAKQSLMRETARAYADVRRAEAALLANEKTLENLIEQRRYVEANQRAGFLTATDLAQADGRIASARSGVARAGADLVSAQRVFQRLVGRPPGSLEPLAAVADLPQSQDEALQQSQARRKLLEAARHSVRAADAGIDAAQAAGRPRLTLEASSSISNGFDGPGTARSIDDVVGLRLVVPFSSGGANWARARQQRAFRDAARQEVAITLADLDQNVAVAWNDLVAARVALAASAEEIAAAELALRGVRREQESGLRAIVDVLNQEQDLLEAQLSRARAERDVAEAEYRLLFETGALECRSCE